MTFVLTADSIREWFLLCSGIFLIIHSYCQGYSLRGSEQFLYFVWAVLVNEYIAKIALRGDFSIFICVIQKKVLPLQPISTLLLR